MNNDLKEQLHKVLDRPRPRPLMFIGRRNGKKVYVRKQSLSYFQLIKKYPAPHQYIKAVKPRHIFQRQHHLAPRRLRRKMGSYIVWGCLIGFLTLSVIIYTVAFVKSVTPGQTESGTTLQINPDDDYLPISYYLTDDNYPD